MYAPELVDACPRLLQEVANAKALILRNRTQVNIGRLGVGLVNSDVANREASGISGFFKRLARTMFLLPEYVIPLH